MEDNPPYSPQDSCERRINSSPPDRSKSGDYERLHPDPEISELCRAQLTWYVLRRKRRKERKRKQKLAKRKKRAAAKAAKAKAAGEAVGANGGAKNRLSLFAERMRALGKKVKESSSNGGDQKEDSEESELSSSSVSSQSGAEATMRAELRLLGILKGGGKPVDKKKKGKNCSSGSSSSSSSSVSSKSSTSTTLSQFKLKNGPRIDKVPLCRFCTNTSGRGSCAAVPPEEDNLERQDSPPAGATSAAVAAPGTTTTTDKATAANKKPPKKVKKAKAKKPKPGCDPQTGKEIGILKPDGIYFGETLESKVLKKAIQTALHSEVVLLVGTTGKVDPARQMPIMAKLHNRAKVIECNPNRTLLSKTADLDLREPSARCLPRLVEYVRVMGDVLGYGNHGGSSSSASSVSGGGAGEPGKAGAASSAFSSAVSSAEGGGSQGPRATAKGRVVVG